MKFFGIRFQIILVLTIILASGFFLISLAVFKAINNLPLADTRSALESTLRWVAVYSVIDIIILIFLGLIFLSRWIVDPIKKMIDTTEAIADGDFDKKVEVGGYNEIGQLGRAFNQMGSRLKEGRNMIEEQIESLERVNKELGEVREGLIRNAKMASVGRLAAGIAHEIGNPLGVILGYLDMISSDVKDNSSLAKYVGKIEGEATRIDGIIRELLDFSRPAEPRTSVVEINPLIEESISLVSPQSRFEKVTIKMVLTDGSPKVLVDPDRLKQVMVNLLFNAADAMPDGGELKIATIIVKKIPRAIGEDLIPIPKPRPMGANLEIGQVQSSGISYPQEESFVEISFSDTGVGIPPNELDKVFEPFYTTKEKGKGTGLGLAVCYRIIELLKGDIRVKSEVGVGTIFTIKLPEAEKGESELK